MKRQYYQTILVIGLVPLVFILSSSAALAATNTQSWTSESSYEGPRHTGSSTANGTVTRTGQQVSWEAEKQGVTDEENEWEATTSGSGSKTDQGYEWSSTTRGTTENGRTWTTERQAEAVKNADGTMTIDRSATKTADNGAVLTRQSETVVTKTEDGKTWQTTGTQTGPKGTGSMSANGSAVKTGDGVNVNINRQGATAGGKTWESTTTGSGAKTETGRKWSSATSGSAEGGSLLRRSKASGYEGQEAWKRTSEGELKKSGNNTNIKRKSAVENQSAATSGKNLKSGSGRKAKYTAGK